MKYRPPKITNQDIMAEKLILLADGKIDITTVESEPHIYGGSADAGPGEYLMGFCLDDRIPIPLHVQLVKECRRIARGWSELAKLVERNAIEHKKASKPQKGKA
jgi:hypothetical protein